LEHGKGKFKTLLIKSLKGKIKSKIPGQYVALSQHKFASNVIESCFKNGGKKEKQDIIDELTGKSNNKDKKYYSY
jgi:hypothetical protein